MGKVSDDPRVYMREAVAIAKRVIDRPSALLGRRDEEAVKLGVKVLALAEAFEKGAFKLVRRTKG